MQTLAKQVIADYPAITFEPGEQFVWSPETRTVYYQQPALQTTSGIYSLLHELGHALMGHSNYSSDINLIQLERQAWQKAAELGKKYRVTIDKRHIEDCLDTYRDWLLARALCPNCSLVGIQSQVNRKYHCINCPGSWSVPETAACVTRRQKSKQTKTTV